MPACCTPWPALQAAVDHYVGEDYIQHNPDVADGKQGFIDYFNRMQSEYPDKSIEFVRAVAEGDLVALHTHQIWPGNDQYIGAKPKSSVFKN